MKASETKPTAWRFGMKNPKIFILMRKWEGIRKNVKHMEDTMLKLMSNPETTPEQLSMAAKLYADVTLKLNEAANMIDAYLYHGTKPEFFSTHMMSCAAYKTGNEELCNCKDWQEGEM
jgi:hypothetical protein